MKHLLPKICLNLAGVALAAAVTAGTAGAATPAHTPAWHPVLTLKNVNSAHNVWSFTSVVTTGKTTGWAFLRGSSQQNTSYRRTSATTWKQVAFPGQGCRVNVAAAAKGGRVFASCERIVGNSREYEWSGTKWVLIRTLPGAVSSLSVLSATDVWYFGDHGVVHWNGKTWKQLTKSTDGGSARSDTDVWVFTGEVISHYNGKKWTAVQSYGPTGITGILALSATSVYATGTEAAAAALLHYNGKRWSRTWESGDQETFPEQRIVRDGKGGLWILAADDTERAQMLHYTGGKMRVATLPAASFEYYSVSNLAQIPGTAEMLLAGVGVGTNELNPVIFQYS